MQLPNNLIGWQPFEWCRIKTEFKSCFHIREIDFSCFRLLWITFTWMISLLVEKKNTELFAKEQSEQCSEYRQFWAGDIAINTSIYQYFLHYDSTWIIRLSCSGGNALLMWFSVIIVPFVGHFMLFFIEIHAKRIHAGFYLCWNFAISWTSFRSAWLKSHSSVKILRVFYPFIISIKLCTSFFRTHASILANKSSCVVLFNQP